MEAALNAITQTALLSAIRRPAGHGTELRF
jgi:hypothetical protein